MLAVDDLRQCCILVPSNWNVIWKTPRQIDADTSVSQLLNGKSATNMRPYVFSFAQWNTKLGHTTNAKEHLSQTTLGPNPPHISTHSCLTLKFQLRAQGMWEWQKAQAGVIWPGWRGWESMAWAYCGILTQVRLTAQSRKTSYLGHLATLNFRTLLSLANHNTRALISLPQLKYPFVVR